MKARDDVAVVLYLKKEIKKRKMIKFQASQMTK